MAGLARTIYLKIVPCCASSVEILPLVRQGKVPKVLLSYIVRGDAMHRYFSVV